MYVLRIYQVMKLLWMLVSTMNKKAIQYFMLMAYNIHYTLHTKKSLTTKNRFILDLLPYQVSETTSIPEVA